MKGEKELIGTIVKILFVNPHGSMTRSTPHRQCVRDGDDNWHRKVHNVRGDSSAVVKA
jgi:hypothetical protein